VIFNIAFLFSTGIWIALFGDKALSLTPVEDSIDVAAFTAIAALITIDDFLGGEDDFTLWLLTDAVRDHWESCHGISAWTVALILNFLNTVGVLLSPVKLVGNDWLSVFFGFAWSKVRSIRKSVSEKGLSIW